MGEEFKSRFKDGNIEVRNNKYEKEIDLSSFKRGEIEIWVAFQTVLDTKTSQPKDVIDLYGELGERIIDEEAVTSGPIKRIEKIKNLSL